MKTILMSVKPKLLEKILNGQCTILLSKKRPNIYVPFRCVLFCFDTMFDITDCPNLDAASVQMTDKSRGKAMISFTCDKVIQYEPQVIACAYYEMNCSERYLPQPNGSKAYMAGTCVSYEDMVNCSKGKALYGLHIGDLKIIDEPQKVIKIKGGRSAGRMPRLFQFVNLD